MSTWSIALQDGSRVDCDNPYGHTHEITESGRFHLAIVLSPINRRVQVLNYSGPDFSGIAKALEQIATANGYDKIWIKAHGADEPHFREAGFETEATIPRYFNGSHAVIVSRFLSDERRHRPRLKEEEDILSNAMDGTVPTVFRRVPADYKTSIFTEADAQELAQLYAEVFPTYPYPISDPAYLVETASSHVVYRIIRNGAGRLVAAASAETVPEYRCAEMTDFASLPGEQGKGLAQYLLRQLEEDARERFGIQCFFTIARAVSFGMLRTFHNCGYAWSGTLVNNCTIAGQFETMHVLYKPWVQVAV